MEAHLCKHNAPLQAQAQFEAARNRFEREQQEVDGLLQKRDDAYLDMLAIHDEPTTVTASAAHREFPLKGIVQSLTHVQLQ